MNIKRDFTSYIYTFFKNWKSIFFCLLLTSGIYVGAYILQLILFVVIFKKIQFDKILLNKTILILGLLLIAYVGTLNSIILKYIGLIIFNFILFEASKRLFSKKNELKSIIDFVFFFHVFFILLSFFVPSINRLLSSSSVESIRYAGLIRGYDFVPFICGTFIICEFRYNKYKIDGYFALKLFLSIIVTLLSGRFGLFVFLIIFIQILFVRFSFAKLLGFIFFLIICMIVFWERIQFSINTVSNILNYVENNDITVFKQPEGENLGYYGASPITWYTEFKMPFNNFFSYLLPKSSETVVDTGISYVFLNLGILLGSCLYLYASSFFVIRNKIYYPLFLIFLLIDIKFRSLLVVLPMFWLYLNIFKITSQEIKLINIP